MVLLVAGILGAKPAYGVFKTFRAHRYADEAEEFLRNQDQKSAFFKLRSALLLSPGDIRVNRIVAEQLSKSGQELALNHWNIVLSGPSPTLADREQYVGIAMRVGREDLAFKELDSLLGKKPLSATTLVLASKASLIRRDFPKATEYVREAISLSPTNTSAQLQFAYIAIQSGAPDSNGEVRKSLWSLTNAEGEPRTGALALLAGLRDLSDAERDLLVKICTAPNESVEVRLLGADLEIRYNLRPRDVVIRGITSRFSSEDPDELSALVRWFNRHHLFNSTLTAIPVGKQAARTDLFLAKMEAYIGLRRWSDAYELLSEDPIPLDPMTLEFHRVRVARNVRNGESVASHWQKLFALAALDPLKLKRVAASAEAIGAREQAILAYQKLATTGRDATEAYVQLIRIAEQMGDTKRLRDQVAKISAIKKENHAIQNQLTYLNLLLNEDLAGSKNAAIQLVNQFPTNFAYRVTLALALLRENNPAVAKETLVPVTTEWLTSHPYAWAVCAAVSGANKMDDMARQMTDRIVISTLKPEERELIKPWLRAPIVSPPPASGSAKAGK